jgi:hypothetical protein
LGHRLKDEVFADVPHRHSKATDGRRALRSSPKGECPDGIHEWVFTIPKRLRVYFRFDRSLLGRLCRVAYDTVREVYALEIDGDLGIPAMVGAVQTFGDLIQCHLVL